MQKIISFFTLAIGALSSLYAQAPGIQWQKTIGGNFDDFPSELLQTADGGYILGGQSNSSISGDKPYIGSLSRHEVIEAAWNGFGCVGVDILLNELPRVGRSKR